jgi:hypothetical protein
MVLSDSPRVVDIAAGDLVSGYPPDRVDAGSPRPRPAMMTLRAVL